MNERQIIMNFSVPPSADDLGVMASDALENLPEELSGFTEGLAVTVEEIVDEATELSLDLEDSFELLALYKSGKEISPGVERKTANDDDVLVLYRRPILDMWCENHSDLMAMVRQVMIEELGRNFDFSEDEIDEMVDRHYQGMF